jgi:hypothetical protein
LEIFDNRDVLAIILTTPNCTQTSISFHANEYRELSMTNVVIESRHLALQTRTGRFARLAGSNPLQMRRSIVTNHPLFLQSPDFPPFDIQTNAPVLHRDTSPLGEKAKCEPHQKETDPTALD